MKVRADLNLSLDGFGATTDGTPSHPTGKAWFRLIGAHAATRVVFTRHASVAA